MTYDPVNNQYTWGCGSSYFQTMATYMAYANGQCVYANTTSTIQNCYGEDIAYTPSSGYIEYCDYDYCNFKDNAAPNGCIESKGLADLSIDYLSCLIGTEYFCDTNKFITEMGCTDIETMNAANGACYCNIHRTIYPLISNELQTYVQYFMDYYFSLGNIYDNYLGCESSVTCDLKDNGTFITTSTTSDTDRPMITSTTIRINNTL